MSASPSHDEEDSASRQRVSRACDLCRRKKVKCDGASPVCTNCKALDLTCTFNDKTKKRGPPKGYIEAVENRLYKLENFLADLAKGGDISTKELLVELNAPLSAPSGEQIDTRPLRRAPRSERSKVFYWQRDQAGKRKREALQKTQRQYMSYNGTDILHISTEEDTTAAEACFHDINDNNDDNAEGRLKKRKINETTAVLGQLSMDESGHVRYLGKSSGYYLLQKSKTYQNGAFHFANYGRADRLHQNHLQHTKPVTDPHDLPPKDLAEHLTDLYFQHFYPFLPLFYKRQLNTGPITASTPPSPLLLNAIYAVASRISPDIRVRADPSEPDTAGDVFFERAERLLDESYDTPSISTVQALLLLSTHQHGVMRSARAWLYSGMAFRMAQDLGLHRNFDTWNISPEERETRKRVFWCCYIVDRLASAMFGRAFTFEERDCDTPLPSIDDDEPITMFGQSKKQQPDVDNDIRLLDIFKNLIKMADILGHVLKNVYYVRSLQNADDRQIELVLSTWNKKLHQWYEHLPDSLQLQPLATAQSDTSFLLTPAAVCQLHMMYHTTMILLHRPFIPNPEQSYIPTATMLPCSSNCSAAADSIIHIINDMLNSQQLGYLMNFSVYYIFTAAVVFIQQATTDNDFVDQQHQQTAKKEMVSQWKLRRCMLALNEIEATWPTASKTCQILAELSGLSTGDKHQQQLYAQSPQQPTYHPGASQQNNANEASSTFNSYGSLSSQSSSQSYLAQVNTSSMNGHLTTTNHSVMRSQAAVDLRYRVFPNIQMQQQSLMQQQQQQQQQQQATPIPTTHLGMDFVIPDPFQVPTSSTDHAMDPFAAPGIIPLPSHRPQPSPMSSFNPLETALGGLPTNNNSTHTTTSTSTTSIRGGSEAGSSSSTALDANTWGHFMAANMQQPQQQQQQSPFINTTTTHSKPTLVNNRTPAPTHSTTTTEHHHLEHIHNHTNTNSTASHTIRSASIQDGRPSTTDVSNGYYW